MTGTNGWSYSPYQPYISRGETIYISRIVPEKNGIHIEWIGGDSPFYIYCRKRNHRADAISDIDASEAHFTSTDEHSCRITGLTESEDYEIAVSDGRLQSAMRFARCGESVGQVVNYLHPDDNIYAFSGRYLCSPSMVRHPEGYLLSSMDVYAKDHPQNLTLIYRSDDDGESWHYVSELFPCFWGKLFIHRGELYMLACSTEYGDLLIGKSTDGGKSFSAPVCLLRGSGGKEGKEGVHKNPQNMAYHGGRLYGTLEWGCWANKEYGHAAMVMSCDEDADLLSPESWHFSKPLKFDRFCDELSDLPMNTMTIEGTLTVDPEGRLLNVMRFGKYHTAIVYEVDTEDHDAPLHFLRCMEFPANYSKFMIKRDAASGYYYSVATRTTSPEDKNHRNLLSLLRSPDLEAWEVVTDIYDRRDGDHAKIGFQYVDFEFEGDDIIFLCRTALNGANSYHDSNYSTFDRIKKFRTL